MINLLLSKSEYEQTLTDYENIILTSESFVETRLDILDLDHLRQEIEKQRKFFINLSHCTQVLKTLEDSFSAEVQNLYREHHTDLNQKSKEILDKAAPHMVRLEYAFEVWFNLKKKDEELKEKLEKIRIDLSEV